MDFPEDTPYWQRRIQEANKRNLSRTNAQLEQELKRLYEEQSETLYKQILEVFAKISEDSLDGKIYTNDLYRTNNYHLLLKYFNACAQKLGGKQIQITDEAVLRTYKYAQSVVEAFAPEGVIQPQFIAPERHIDPVTVINRSWCIDGKNYSDRIWLGKKELEKGLRRTLEDFCVRGSSPFKLAQELTKRVGVDTYSAYRIARTETAHAQVMGQAEKYKELGFTQAKWFATDACDECAALNGQVFNLNTIQSMLPRHPNCECSFLLVTD